MIYYRTNEEIEMISKSAYILSSTLGEVSKNIRPGIDTAKLDYIAEEYIRDHAARPAFKNYGNANNPFPATLCTSINHEVVHGIPSTSNILHEGDIISIDCGVEKDGYYADQAYTFMIGEVEKEIEQLLCDTYTSLLKGIEQSVHGNYIGDISCSIQKYCEDREYGVIRELIGHGIGKNLHEDPPVPNYGKCKSGPRLREGMVLAIEPMITIGNYSIKTLSDGWTIETSDKSIAAHFEHTVVVRKNKAEILTTTKFIQDKYSLTLNNCMV